MLGGEGYAAESVVRARPVDGGDAFEFGWCVAEAIGERALAARLGGEGFGCLGAGCRDGRFFCGERGGHGALSGGGCAGPCSA